VQICVGQFVLSENLPRTGRIAEWELERPPVRVVLTLARFECNDEFGPGQPQVRSNGVGTGESLVVVTAAIDNVEVGVVLVAVQRREGELVNRISVSVDVPRTPVDARGRGQRIRLCGIERELSPESGTSQRTGAGTPC